MRKLLFQIHLWTGLILFAPLVLIGLSGSLLVYHDELDALFKPKTEIVTSGGTARSYDEIAAAALKDWPYLLLDVLGTGLVYGLFLAVVAALLSSVTSGRYATASLLFGFLRSGGINMEMVAGVPTALVMVIQGLIVITLAGSAFWLDRKTAR